MLLFLSSFLYFFLAFIGFSKQNVDPNKYDQVTGVIVGKGVSYRLYSKQDANCFYFELEGMNKKLGLYRMSKDYTDLLHTFKIGDTVTAFYDANNNTDENINTNLIQVTGNNQILLNKDEYESQGKFLIYIGLIAGIGSIILSYLYYKGKILRRH